MLITHQALAEHLTHGLSFPRHAVLVVCLLLLEVSSPGIDITKGVLTRLAQDHKASLQQSQDSDLSSPECQPDALVASATLKLS